MIPRGNWLHKWLHTFRNPVFAGVLGVDRLPPKQKATGSSPVGGMAGNPLFAGVSGLSLSAYTTFCRVRITAIRTFFGSKWLHKWLHTSGRRPRLEQLLGKLQLNRGEVHDPRTRRHCAEGRKQALPVHSEGLRSSEEGSSAHGQANGSRQEAEEDGTQETLTVGTVLAAR